MSLCPGQDHRKLTVCNVTCPECGKSVEMFSDELRIRCPRCKTMIVKEQMPSCIQWCQAARDCVGPKIYQELTGESENTQDETQSATSTDLLKHEHQVILKVLDAAEREVEHIQQNSEIRTERVQKMIDFFREYADRWHHAKEEKLLFEKMKQRGIPVEGSPIGVMLFEHDQFRGRVRAVSEALPAASQGDQAALSRVGNILRTYVHTLREHINKEDILLYTMADNLLSEADQKELSEAFARMESEHTGEDVTGESEEIVVS